MQDNNYGQQGQEFSQNQQTGSQTVQQQSSHKSGKGLKIVTACFAILAIAGICFGVIEYNNNLSLNSKVEANNAIISSIETKTGTSISTTDDVASSPAITSSNTKVSDYIYVPEWDIKIKKSDKLKGYSYTYDFKQDAIYILADIAGSQNFPDFADIQKNHDGLVSISRSSTKNLDQTTDDQFVTEIDGSYYFYGTAQGAYSSTQEEAQTEIETLKYAKEMVSNADNYSKI